MNARGTRTPYTVPTLVGFACILLIMAGSLISACDSSGSNGNGSPDALIPLEVGNQWTASVRPTSFAETANAEVVSDGELSLTLSGDGDSMESTLTVSQQSDGLLLESLITGGETDIILLKYPAEQGDSYQHTDGDGTTYQIEVSETSASVPAGDYSGCLQYEIRRADSGNLNSTLTVKPGVGPVRWSNGNDPDDAQYTLTSTNVDG